jgi:hypothetical protein
MYQMRNTSNGRKFYTNPKCKMIEHIIAQYDYNANYVRNILNETKVGAMNQPAILKMIKNVMY